jgi:hypothetical protein
MRVCHPRRRRQHPHGPRQSRVAAGAAHAAGPRSRAVGGVGLALPRANARRHPRPRPAGRRGHGAAARAGEWHGKDFISRLRYAVSHSGTYAAYSRGGSKRGVCLGKGHGGVSICAVARGAAESGGAIDGGSALVATAVGAAARAAHSSTCGRGGAIAKPQHPCRLCRRSPPRGRAKLPLSEGWRSRPQPRHAFRGPRLSRSFALPSAHPSRGLPWAAGLIGFCVCYVFSKLH